MRQGAITSPSLSISNDNLQSVGGAPILPSNWISPKRLLWRERDCARSYNAGGRREGYGMGPRLKAEDDEGQGRRAPIFDVGNWQRGRRMAP